MKARWVVALGALSVPQQTLAGSIEDGLAALHGKPIQAAIDILGYPSRQMEIGEERAYFWSTAFTSAFSANTPDPHYAGDHVSTKSTESSVDHSCELQVGVGPDGLVRRTRYSGDMDGCREYRIAFKRAAREGR